MVMMVAVMMVMMTAAAFFMVFHMAVLFMAMFAGCFQLQSGVDDAMLPQLPAHSVLNVVRVTFCHNVHGGIVAVAVHAPDMNVMHIQHTLNMAQVLPNFR